MDYERYVNLPLDSYILAEGEELRRPEVIRRLSFDDLFPRAYWFEAAPFARHIVPIELVEPGDVQVVVYKKAGELRPEPLDIDFLADFPGIISVVANRLVTARRPLPHIRELFVVNNATTVDQETLSNLPGLVSLSLGSGFVSRELELEEIETYDWEADKLDLNVLRCMPDLRDLRLHALAAHSIEPLGYLDTLERLRIEGFHRGRSASHLGSLRKLRWLALEDRTGLNSLRELVNLERVEMMDASLTSLKAFAGWKKLRTLALSGRGVRSVESIETLESLEELFLWRVGARDLAPLGELPRLRRLELTHPYKEIDLSPLGRLENLERLVVLLGNATTTGMLPSLDFIAGLKCLQVLDILGGVIADGRLDALTGLPDLRRVRLLGSFGSQAEELRRAKPGCVIELTPWPPETALDVIRIGELEIRQIEDFWSIFQDLSDSLGVENNFAADRKVRQAIRQRAPDLFKRLEFDPDADFISIRAGNEADIRRAAEIIQSIL